MDHDRIKENWSRRGFSCGLWVDPPGQVWEDYVHSTDELVMVLAGRLELEFQGRRLSPAVGDEILIPAGVSHTVRNIGESTARWLYGYKQ
jgi:quercetin dioxygenase-like cupin family protein